MRLMQCGAILLVSIAFCSIKGISEDTIKRLKEESGEKTRCTVCHLYLLDGEKEANGTLLLTVGCPNDNEEHISHTKCFANLCVTKFDGKILCPECHKDCGGAVLQALVNYQDNKLIEPLRMKMLERMNTIPGPKLERFFDRMNFTIDDYRTMAESIVGTQYEQVDDAVANRITNGLFNYKSLYEHLVSEKIDHISTEEYKRLLIRYICSSSGRRLTHIFKRLLEREYLNEKEKYVNAKNFVEILVTTPNNIELSASDACNLLSDLLRHGMADSAKFVLENTDIVHAMDIVQAISIIIQSIRIGNDDGLAIAKNVWIHSIFMCTMNSLASAEKFREQVEQVIVKCSSSLSKSDFERMWDKIIEMKLVFPGTSPTIGMSQAKTLIKEMARRKQQYLDTAQILKEMKTSGILGALAKAPQKKHKRFFKRMFDSRNGHLFKNLRMCIWSFRNRW